MARPTESGVDPQSVDLYEELLRMRDRDRDRKNKAVFIVKNRQLTWQNSRQGKIKWYMHPMIDSTVFKNLIVYMQEIPAGSRTGRQKQQGGQVMYILEGSGYSLIDGVRHNWEAGDCVLLPRKSEGVVHQHFNLDPEKRVLFVAAQPNQVGALGVDMGSGFEHLEDAPEYPGK